MPARELALIPEGVRAPRRGEAVVTLVDGAWVFLSPDVAGGAPIDPQLVPAAPGTWRVEGTGIVLRDVPAVAPWETPFEPGT